MRGSKWLLSIACLVALPAKGQFTLEADTNRIQWGERVTLTATWMTSLAALKATPETTWSAWQDSLETSLDVLKTHPLDTAAAPPSSGMEVMVSRSRGKPPASIRALWPSPPLPWEPWHPTR